jgi:hypothetical protein
LVIPFVGSLRYTHAGRRIEHVRAANIGQKRNLLIEFEIDAIAEDSRNRQASGPGTDLRFRPGGLYDRHLGGNAGWIDGNILLDQGQGLQGHLPYPGWTQRVLFWGDPEFAAGYGRCSMFAGSDGVRGATAKNL